MTVWHPPRSVVELVELVAIGALASVPTRALEHAPDAPDGEWTIEDVEGTPVATLAPDGAVTALRPFAQPPLRSRRITPAELATRDGGQLIERQGVIVDGPVTSTRVAQLRRSASGPLLWMPVIGAGRTGSPRSLRGLDEYARWRATTALAEQVGREHVMVPIAVPLGFDEELDEVARSYGAHEVIVLSGPGNRSDEEVLHSAFLAEMKRAARAPSERGLVLFFTGLSGSGKSTLAQAVTERLRESGARTVTMLDGDEVRRMLSSGLGFSAQDRAANIRRIGYVAAEVSRHGGLAVCAPIAPFADGRAEVRTMVEAAGADLVLIHVSTPLAECERRDRKGLYAKARAGQIPEFTGISSPYEEPDDADLSIDTSRVTLGDSITEVWSLLQARGYLVEG